MTLQIRLVQSSRIIIISLIVTNHVRDISVFSLRSNGRLTRFQQGKKSIIFFKSCTYSFSFIKKWRIHDYANLRHCKVLSQCVRMCVCVCAGGFFHITLVCAEYWIRLFFIASLPLEIQFFSKHGGNEHF